jgi:hypothetical protein
MPQNLRNVLCIVGLSIFVTQCTPALRGTLACEGVQILSDQLTVAEAEEYCRYAVRERKKWQGFGAILGMKPFALTSAVLTGLVEPWLFRK